MSSDFESDVWSADEEEIDGDVFSADRKMDEFSGGNKRDVWSVDDEMIEERINLSEDCGRILWSTDEEGVVRSADVL